jgi:hypothetical protein
MAYDLRITEFEPNKKFTAEFTNGCVKGSNVTYMMEPAQGGKTKLTPMGEVKLGGLAKLMQPVLAWRFGEGDVARVKRTLEAETILPKEASTIP